jgi:hypothetical protein
VAAIAGCVRLARRTRKLQYPLAAAGIAALLLIWHFTPDQRFVFPLYPFLAAGLWTELANVCRTLRVSWSKPTLADRCAAALVGGLISVLALFVIFTHVYGVARFLPDLFDAYRSDLDARRPAYEWIERNTPRDASVFAYDDPLVYLYAGRKSCSLPIPPKLYYHGDEAAIDKLVDSTPDFARRYDLTYALITPGDFYRDLHARGATRLAKAVTQSHNFQPLFTTPGASVYRSSAIASATLRTAP